MVADVAQRCLRALFRPGRFSRAVPFSRLALASTLAVVLIAAAGAQEDESRLVAIGDIHGAGSAVRAVLQKAGLIDQEDHWIGGRATLVQTGDYTDRGPDVRSVMDLLMRIEDEADDAGGRVEVLLGNHETMNLTAEVRDATLAIFASFADSRSADRREEAARAYEEYVEARVESLGRPLPDHQTREEWMAAHPPGFLEYMDALGPDGVYGRWLRSKSVAVKIDDTVFLHGGLSVENDAESVSEVVERASDEIERFDDHRRHLVERGIILPFSTYGEILTAVALELEAWNIRFFPGPPAPGRSSLRLTPNAREDLDVLIDLQSIGSWSVFDPEGPVWFRGFAQWSEDEGQVATTTVFDRFGVTRAVAGHTPTSTRRIVSRFDNRLFLIDTGMLTTVYRGQPAALELSERGVTAIYLAGREPIVP